MEVLSQNYEKYLNEIQFLKKQVNGEKLSHQNTLKQLESTYQMIDQMKDMLRVEQTNNYKLKSQLGEKTNRMMAISSQYEQQISDIKEMIEMKDQQLKRMGSVLMVSDYDVIRLKVINELELTHKEELERVHLQINRKNNELNEVKSNYTLLQNKHNYLVAQLKKQEEEFQSSNEETNNKLMKEISSIYQNLQKERSENIRWAKKSQLQQNKHKKQIQFLKQQISKLSKQLQTQNQNILSNNPTKTNKLIIQKLQEQIYKYREQADSDKELLKKAEEEIGKLKKDINNYKKNQYDLVSQKEKSEEQLEHARKDFNLRENQFKQQIQRVKREYQNNSENIDAKVKQQKDINYKLELQLKKINVKVTMLEEENQVLKQKAKQGGLALIKKELSKKQDQIQRLLQQISSCKKKENDRKRTISVVQKKDDSAALRNKLNEANDKIVQLLRQKIQLKQQMSQLKRQMSQLKRQMSQLKRQISQLKNQHSY